MLIVYKEALRRLPAGFYLKPEARRQWDYILKVLKEKQNKTQQQNLSTKNPISSKTVLGKQGASPTSGMAV